jgi:hypothetical protein
MNNKIERRRGDKGAGVTDVLLWVLLAILTLVVLYGGILAWFPYNPLRLDSFTLDKTEVCRGEKVCFKITGEKFYPVPVHVSVELINGESIAIVNYVSNHPVGEGFKPRCFNIPYHIEPKKYQLRWTGVYQMNAFNYVRRTALSEWITIRPGTAFLRGDKGDTGKTGAKGDKGDKGGLKLW